MRCFESISIKFCVVSLTFALLLLNSFAFITRTTCLNGLCIRLHVRNRKQSFGIQHKKPTVNSIHAKQTETNTDMNNVEAPIQPSNTSVIATSVISSDSISQPIPAGRLHSLIDNNNSSVNLAINAAIGDLKHIKKPMIYSKEDLFGTTGRNSAVNMLASNTLLESAARKDLLDKSKLPKGFERLEPSQLVKTNSNDSTNDGDGGVMIVDKFSFRVDPESLRNAIAQRSAVDVVQQRSVNSIESINSVLDGNEGDDTSPKRSVQLDYDLIEKLSKYGVME